MEDVEQVKGLTVADIVSLVSTANPFETPSDWPPDAFAVAAYLLKITGLHSTVLSGPWPPAGQPVVEWAAKVRQVGDRWRADTKCPEEVVELWHAIAESRALLISDLRNTSARENEAVCKFAHALIEVVGCADEAWTGVVQIGHQRDEGKLDKGTFRYTAARLLQKTQQLGKDIDTSVVSVLPKNQTAQIGFNLRSLTNNLALWNQPEVTPTWVPSTSLLRDAEESQGDSSDSQVHSAPSRSVNLLLLPWPYRIRPGQFKPADTVTPLCEGYGCFEYSPSSVEAHSLYNKISAMLVECEQMAGQVDCIVLPELALTVADYHEVRDHLRVEMLRKRKGGEVGLISGVADRGVNAVAVSTHTDTGGSAEASVLQHKHHRWKLDRSQIVQYGLGGSLGTDTQWWEHIDISHRQVFFHQASPWLNLSVLICEDLARQDPVAQLIRTVGPNLVLALLMDGPQVKGRWADRYASVLADDPGSSVLSFTSVGMVNRSAHPTPYERPLSGCTACTIGLWRDSETGTHELVLKENSCGLLLTLNAHEEKQVTADGREAHTVPRNVIVLSAVHQVPGSRNLDL